MINTNQLVDQYYESSLNEELFILSDREQDLNLLMQEEYYGNINREISEIYRTWDSGGMVTADELPQGREEHPTIPGEEYTDTGYAAPLKAEELFILGYDFNRGG